MCGIAGFINPGNDLSRSSFESIIKRMTDTLIHRGPDDQGVWLDFDRGVAFGHRRLSILDLSKEGHQPMISENGRFVAVLNGEIYNYQQLKKELKEEFKIKKWRGSSDTEVLLAAISQWGIEEALNKCNGMFAIGLYDRRDRVLYLARDRIGKKPLYYGWVGKSFVFGSELKALRSFPGFSRNIDRDALTLYLRYNYVPSPYSIYQGIKKLPGGNLLTLPIGKGPDDLKLKPYWALKDVVAASSGKKTLIDEQDAADQLESLLTDAVKIRMNSDVPLGAFLSGGIDSSVVVSLMQAQSSSQIKTYTIGMYEQGYNEAISAKEVARHLGTDHTEFYITPKDAISVIPKLPKIFDEPFADSSQIPTFLVSELTRKHVTVCLSGDGGDELFCGYNRYFMSRRLWNKIKLLPYSLRKTIAGMLYLPTPGQWDKVSHFLRYFLKDYGTQGTFGDKFHKIASVLTMSNPEQLYLRLVTHWEHPQDIVIGGSEPLTLPTNFAKLPVIKDFTKNMMYLDMMTSLPDDIMVKVDRTSMSVGLEARAPLLDYRLLEFSWRLPLSMMLQKGRGKHLLRKILAKHVPTELVDRPKWGFGVPIGLWLRSDLREWAESLIEEKRLQREGFFKPEPIRKAWAEHLSGKRNWQFLLWDILMFQAWKEYWERES